MACGDTTNPLQVEGTVDVRSTRSAAVEITPEGGSVSLVPPTVGLAPGDEFSFETRLMNGAGEVVANPTGLVFDSSNPEVLESRGNGRYVAKQPGEAKASVTQGALKAEATVTVSAPAACSALDSFTEKVQPVLETKCVSCHSSSGSPAASGAFAINPAAGDAQIVSSNWLGAKTKLDAAKPGASKLLQKISGAVAHGGGSVVAASDPAFGELSSWAEAEAKCLRGDVITAIALSPVEATVKSGARLKLTVNGSSASGATTELTSGVTWQVEADGAPATIDVAMIAADGTVTAGAKLGAFKVIAKYEALEANATLTVVDGSVPEPTCTAFQAYKTDVEPILQESCLSCHGAGGAGSANLSLAGPSPTETELKLNHAELLKRIDLSQADKSLLLDKVTARVAHGGGAVLPADGASYAKLSAWAAGESGCFTTAVTTLKIMPAAPQLTAGESVQLKAMVLHKDETTTEASAGVEWTLDPTDLPAGTALSATGLLTTSTAGSAKVKAKLGASEAAATVTINPVQTSGVKSIDVTPAALSLTVGGVQELSATVAYEDGTQSSNPAGLSFASSNPSVAAVNGRIVEGKGAGSTQLTATFGNVTKAIDVTVAASADCPSLPTFVAKVQPIIESKCAGCHGAAGNAAAAALELKSIPAKLACQQRYANWTHAKAEINYGDLLGSLLLAKPLGTVSHLGGVQLDEAQAEGLKQWLNVAASCRAVGAASEAASVAELCPKIPVSIAVSPMPLLVKVGATIDVIATVTYDDGTTSTTDAAVSFTSSKPALLTAAKTAAGARLTGVSVGRASLTVKAGAAIATVDVTVQAAQVVLTSLEVEPATAPSLGLGGSQIFKLFGKYSDGSRAQKTTGVTWSVADVNKATIAADGKLTAKAAGTTTVTAKLDDCAPLASCTASRNVTVIGVKTVAVTPAAKSLTVGQTQQMSVTVTYLDDKTSTPTAGVAWSSSAAATATVSATGLVTAKAAGTATVKATFGGVSGSATITAALPEGCPSIATFRAPSGNIASILSQKCASCHKASAGGIGTGAFSFPGLGTSCASQVEDWRAAKAKLNLADPSQSAFVLKPSGRVAHQGGIMLTASQTQLFEAWAVKEAQCAAAGFGESTDLNVLCPKTPVSLSITPSAPDIQVGTNATLVARITYDDGSAANATTGVTWSSSAAAKATIDQTGKLVGVSSGTATITAKVGSLSASVTATVRAADIVITRLDAIPQTLSVPVGETVTLRLKATYSDATTKELTSGVTWTSAAPAKATIGASTGVAKGVAVGTASLEGKIASCTGVANCPAKATATVTAPILKSIAISPSQIVLQSGLNHVFKVMGTYSDGKSSAITSGVTWSTSDTDLLVLTQTGEVTGRAAGYAIVKAKVAGLAEASTNVLVVSANGCSTVAEYQSKIDPIVQGKCISCHGTGGPGSNYMQLKGPNPTAFDKMANWDELRRRVSATNVAGSLLIKKVSDKPAGFHSGGAVLPYSTSATTDYGKVLTWASNEAQCIKENIPTNLTRNSGEVLHLRLAKLFPGASTQTSASLYKLVARDFDMFYSSGLDRVLGNAERNFSTVTLISMRAKVNALCDDYVDTADANNSLFSWTGMLRNGETVPTNAVDKIVLAAARNAWLYPYVATDAEVGVLRTLYNGAAAVSSALQAKKVVCVAALSAPQFWFGNKGEIDTVRRMHLETLRHVPTMTDYDAYTAASNKQDYLKGLLNSTTLLPGFYQAAKSWHRDWLALRDYYSITNGQTRAESMQLGGSFGSAGVSGQAVDEIPNDVSGLVNAIELGNDRFTTNIADFSEYCEKGLEQDFDPRTTEVRVDHFNPVTNAWEMIGSMKKKADGSWQSVNGQISLANGTKKTTSLADITPTTANTELKQCYQTGGLVGTPLECFYGPRFGKLQPNGTYQSIPSKTYMQRRVRRFSPTGEQNGYSKIKLWYSGEDTPVCNTYSRIALACFYRPSTRLPPLTGGINYATGMVAGERTPWNFRDNNRPKIGAPSLRDSYASPLVLDSFRCGVPDGDAIAQLGTASYDENAAYPLGYSSMTGPIDQTAINTIATNPTDFFDKSGARLGVDRVIAANLASTRGENKAVGRFLEDLQNEPLALAHDIIRNNKSYKLLLTADYTFGRTELDLFYRTSGYYLPAYPPGYVPKRGTSNTVQAIRESAIAPIPLAWLRSSWGELGRLLTPAYMKDEIAANEVTAKPMAGILTQMAFVGPVSVNDGKLRSIAARIFSRLLCGLPNEFVSDLDGDAVALHRTFISTAGTGGKAHLDESKGCYSCHVNLDPLASAMKPGFKTAPDTPAIADMKYAPFLGVSNHYGIRGGKPAGDGAIFGTSVSGIKQVGQTLASTPQFSECVVKTGFQNVFGRAPIGDEMGLINDVARQFRTELNYNYTDMIELLISSETFRRAN
jgi:uncharacterized protein YjdB